MPANKDYRENPSRCVYLTGPINQDLVNRLTSKINELRCASSDPITVYIDSPGGSTSHAHTIRRLIKAPNPDGVRCRLIAVVTGSAASAAADFLALADYAYAFGHTDILFHGVRQDPDAFLTVEDAHLLATNLQESNEFYAMRLARSAFARFILRISQLQDEFLKYRNTTGEHSEALDGLLGALRAKLTPANREAVKSAHQKQKIIEELNVSVNKSIRKKKKFQNFSQSQMEVLIFEAILRYKQAKHAKDRVEWLLSKYGIEEITQDFRLLADFFWGKPKRDMAELMDMYGELLLSDELQKAYKELKETEENRTKWLYQHSNKPILPLWYFMVSLCRILQTADFSFDPREAYWLGFVDEVPGSNLPNMRQMLESEAPAPDASATGAPQQP
ncbi:MAG: ATP-dependent Clp protease proteolytic subunit [Methylacidiphilales bacterium]|nr:ATP-dependent Clp protease proteolytic subunit [Candidatus Methylacidiphilales bacterium]